MKHISLVVAMDENQGIGKDNGLLCHLPADLAYFKRLTMGKPIIMGRKTFESIGKPLPGRWNIVLSHQALTIEGVTVVHSLDEALMLTDEEPDVMIIGGGLVFQQALSYVNQIYITLIHHQFTANVFFPRLDHTIWSVREKTFRARDAKNAHDLTFYAYERSGSPTL